MNIYLSRINQLSNKYIIPVFYIKNINLNTKTLNMYNMNIKYELWKKLSIFQSSRKFITVKDVKKNKSEINKSNKYNLDSKIKTNFYATKKYKNDKKIVNKTLKKQLKKNSVDIKLIYDILDYLPKKTFTDKRNVICVILLSIIRCNMNELKNFNKLIIDNLIQDGKLILNMNQQKNTKEIDISDFEKNILKDHFLLIDDFYKNIDDNKHILHSSIGKEITVKTAYTCLNNSLKKIGDEKDIKLLSQSFRIGYISKIIKYYNIQNLRHISKHKKHKMK